MSGSRVAARAVGAVGAVDAVGAVGAVGARKDSIFYISIYVKLERFMFTWLLYLSPV